MKPINHVQLVTLFTQTAAKATAVLLALYAIELGASPVTVGMLATTVGLSPMLLALPIGRMVDRRGVRLPLVLAAAFGAAGMALAWYLANIPSIFIAAILSGFVNANVNVSLQNLVGLLSRPESRTRDFANYTLIKSIGAFLGPLVAGFSIDHVGHDLTCLVVAALYLPPLAMLNLGSFSRHGAAKHKEDKAPAKGRFADLITGPGMRLTLITSALQNVGDILFSFYVPVYCRSIGLSASTIGIILSQNAAAAFCVRIVLPRMIDAFKEARVLAYSCCLGGASLLLMPLTHNALLLGVLAFLFGLGMGVCGPVVTMQMFTSSPPGRSGEALGLRMTMNNATKVVCPVILGYIAGAFGLVPVFWLTAVLLGYTGWINHPAAQGSSKMTES